MKRQAAFAPEILFRARWPPTRRRTWSMFAVNLGEELLSEPRTIGANQKTKDHTRTAAAPGEKGQIASDRTKKDRHTGYADLFHAPSITPNPVFATHGLTGPAHILPDARAFIPPTTTHPDPF
jgi:hypothetical protein